MGMRQRLALAAALLGDPRVLILDEPANGLDPEGIRWLRGFLSRLSREHGKTILVSSHLLQEVAQTVDDVVIIANGRLVRRARWPTSAARPSTFVRTSDPAALAEELPALGLASHAAAGRRPRRRDRGPPAGRRRRAGGRPSGLGAAPAAGRPRGPVPVPDDGTNRNEVA